MREDQVRLGALLVAVLAGLLGLAFALSPAQSAQGLGLDGGDPFAYRSGGAAFVGYLVALGIAWSAPSDRIRIILAATTAAAIATAIAALIALISGHGGLAMVLILVGAIVSAVLAGAGYRRTVAAKSSEVADRDIAPWFVLILGWGVVASGLFGIGGVLLGSTFGKLGGFAGGDDTAYRLAGAATIGILLGTLLSLRSRNWQQVRLVVILGFVTNLLTLIGGLVVASAGNPPPFLWLVLGAALFNTVTLGLGLLRSGR